MRYKFIVLPPLVLLLLALTLAGCGNGNPLSSTEEATGSTEEATKVARLEGSGTKATSRPSKGKAL